MAAFLLKGISWSIPFYLAEPGEIREDKVVPKIEYNTLVNLQQLFAGKRDAANTVVKRIRLRVKDLRPGAACVMPGDHDLKAVGNALIFAALEIVAALCCSRFPVLFLKDIAPGVVRG